MTSLRAFILPLCLFLIISGLYYSTLLAIGIEWTGNGPYSHGLLVVFVVAHIVWHERDLLSGYQQSPQLVGLLTMFVGGGGVVPRQCHKRPSSSACWIFSAACWCDMHNLWVAQNLETTHSDFVHYSGVSDMESSADSPARALKRYVIHWAESA